MKRLLLLAALIAPAARLGAADVHSLPLPTGMAPTSPQVPVPTLVDGLPVASGADWSRTSFRDRLGIPSVRAAEHEAGSTGPRAIDRIAGFRLIGKRSPEAVEPYDTFPGKLRWCEDCAPAARHPLPPLPAGVGRVSGGNCAAGTCVPKPAATATAKESGNCWEKIKGWVCYRQTPVHFPLVPTPREPALYTYFPCTERGGSAGGCATGKAGCNGSGRGGVGGCVPCPQAAETLLPGYRLANPETLIGSGPVVTTSYKTPVPKPR